MAKKKDKTHLEAPEYESLTTIEQVDAMIAKHKDILVGKDVIESRIKQEKKDYVAALNEQLRELNEEREHEIGVLSALEDRKKQIHAQNKVVPLPKPVSQ